MKQKALVMDEKVKELAKQYLWTEGEMLGMLTQMRENGWFAELNYSGIFDYCLRALGLSRAQSYYFKSVAEASQAVPELELAVREGELTLSEARRIAPVITPDNHGEWIHLAHTLSQVELERAVTEANPKAHPRERVRPVTKDLSELKVAVDRETEDNLAVLKELLSQKLGKAATLKDVVAWSAKVMRDKFDPVKKAERKISSGNKQS